MTKRKEKLCDGGFKTIKTTDRSKRVSFVSKQSKELKLNKLIKI